MEKRRFSRQLFLRQTRDGAVLIFKDIDEAKVNELMPTLPLYALKKSVEVFPLIKDLEF
jgi:muconolactone D-isomerase